MFNSDEITADFKTIYEQAADTAESYMLKAVRIINENFGDGYAQAHPELIAAFMTSATSECHTITAAKVNSAAIRSVAESLNSMASALDRISDSLDNVSAAIEQD
nr:hypothetical protein [Comamonas thiooxydans]